MFSFDKGSLLTRLASKWARKVTMALTTLSLLNACHYFFELLCPLTDSETLLYIGLVVILIIGLLGLIDWLLDESWHRGESRLNALQCWEKKKPKIKSKNLYQWYRALAVYLQIVLIIVLNMIPIMHSGGYDIIYSKLSELQRLMALWGQGNLTITVAAVGAAVIGILGTVVAFLDRYAKARKYQIPHGMLRTEIREYADVLLNFVMLAGVGFIAPLSNTLFAPNAYTSAIISIPITFLFVYYTLTWRYNITPKNQLVLYYILMYGSICAGAVGQAKFYQWACLDKQPDEYLALLGLIVPVWAIVESVQFFSQRFVEQGFSTIMEYNRKLYVLVAKYDAATWVAVPCELSETGLYVFIKGKYILTEAYGRSLTTALSADIRNRETLFDATEKPRKKFRLPRLHFKLVVPIIIAEDKTSS